MCDFDIDLKSFSKWSFPTLEHPLVRLRILTYYDALKDT